MRTLKAIPPTTLPRLFEIHHCNAATASTYGQQRCKEVPIGQEG
jgi:hypothetical protein